MPTPLEPASGTRATVRPRLLAAARKQLLDPRGLVAFNVDAVARRAGVSRQTVYNQFGTRAGLLEAVCAADAADSGLGAMLPRAFSEPDPAVALTAFIRAFGVFWSGDRELTRRTRGLAELDPEYAAVLQSLDDRRLQGLSVLLQRFPAPPGYQRSAKHRALLRLLQTLTSFASFDGIAGPEKSTDQASGTIARLALSAIRDAGLAVGPGRPDN